MTHDLTQTAVSLVTRIQALERVKKRLLIAVAGPPGSGKSTLGEAVVDALISAGEKAVLMPMDGFHLDNRIIERQGLLSRKGAPETFDYGGFAQTLARVRGDDTVYLPIFDRTREIAIAGAAQITAETDIVVAEGNYLLLDEAPWRDLSAFWDMSVFLDVPVPELERRLIARWLSYGYAPEQAHAKAMDNDIPNARRVMAHRMDADVIVS